MRLALLNLVVEPWISGTSELLEKYWHPRMLGEAIGRRGHDVKILQHFHTTDVVSLESAEVRFVAPGSESAVHNGVAGFSAIRDVAASLSVDAFHVFGTANADVLHCAEMLSTAAGVPFSVSFHGGKAPAGPLSFLRTRRILRNAAAIYFPSRDRARRWRAVIGRRSRAVVAPELSSALQPIKREEAREQLGLNDEVVFAWAARLNSNKDPLTALRAIDAVSQQLPSSRLLMAYQSAECLDDVQAFLNDRPALAARVRLLGELDRDAITRLFSAADFFLQASHAEIGGNALVEAMSCGAIPVVTDIPSFRQLTGDGCVGRHFGRGQHEQLAAAILELVDGNLAHHRQAVESFFRKALSYDALAEIYEAEFGRMTVQGVPQ